MVNAQEWLNEKYSKEEREKMKELKIDQESLEGDLDLKDFVNLETYLSCRNNQLTNLDLSNCRKLKWLRCGTNQLTKLNLTGLNQLERVECENNYLVSFDYSVLNPEKLTWLNISDNNLLEQDLTVFSRLTNLETLWIGVSNQEKIDKGITNRFHGSLETLKDLKGLQSLYLSNTDINEGLEFLPNGIKNIYCSYQARSTSQVRKLVEQLIQSQDFSLDEKAYLGSDNVYQRIQKKDLTDLDSEQQKQWVVAGFTSKEFQEWVKTGLQKGEVDFAIYLKKKGLVPTTVDQQKLRNQLWLDWKYPLEKKKELEIIDIKNKNLTGELIIEDFPKVKLIDCRYNQLTKLVIINCPNFEVLSVRDNSLTELVIDCPERLTYLSASNNSFPSQDLSFFQKFVNLEELYLNDNSFFGTLEPLKNLKKLKNFDISGNQVNAGLEYMPERTEQISLQSGSDNLEKITQELQVYPVRGASRPSTYNLQQWRDNQPFYQQLKKLLKKLGFSHLYELSPEIFFNVKTGIFEGNLQILTSFLQFYQISFNQEEKIRYLERIVKKQKEKIVEAYLYFAPEKELLQELINIHLEYSRAKQQKIPAFKLRKQRDKLYDRLGESLGEDEGQMEQVEFIFQECEELVRIELELENKINHCKSIEDVGKEFGNWTIFDGNFQKNDLNYNKLIELPFQKEINETKMLEKEELIIRHLEEKIKIKEEFQKREKELLDTLNNIKKLVDEENIVNEDNQLLARQLELKNFIW